ncbi:two-component system response regulator [[Phormidium ambiguum] IAM M-71]|uniref:Two-component system response regulator n=1 Tax=[Phormidium ambiguum] IAM M-71 TaxID=454136 RepID=A0A1U7IFN7_9CYAN|nr:response regulator [Phormidium ambiguum]OKH35869.1 two-component system response regulator [Phormidium ambiguum IAM M-71]
MPNKILVIDDSGVIRKTVKDMLPAGKFEIVEAKDGVEGLNLAKKERPNWIMLDFILPKKSGWDVYQELEKQPELRKIPLVLMSGRKEEVTSKIPEASFKFVEFLVKPFDQKQLMAALKSSMEKVKLRPAPTTTGGAPPASDAGTGAGAVAGAGEIQALKQQIAKLNAEVEALKKQQAQIMAFIKQKLK